MVPVNTAHGAASPQPVGPASVSSFRMAFFTEPATSPEPWRRINRTGMSVTNTVTAVTLICFKRMAPHFTRHTLSRTLGANQRGPHAPQSPSRTPRRRQADRGHAHPLGLADAGRADRPFPAVRLCRVHR